MRISVIYDDTVKKNDVIADIIGGRGFADIVVKNKRLEEYYREAVLRLFPDLEWRKIHSSFEYAGMAQELDKYLNEDVRFLHCFSNYRIADEDKALLSYEKIKYIEEPFAALDGNRVVAVMFPDAPSYMSFCKEVASGQKTWDAAKSIKNSFEMDGVIDIGIVGNFISCITGNIDLRYFNSLRGNEYTLVKSSANKKKIKSEYSFFHLLPEDMKMWFVMPFNYQEKGDTASYTMERLYMTDLAVKWVHGSMDEEEFEKIMDKYFFFLTSRHSRPCTSEIREKNAKALYVDKVISRIEELKAMPQYLKIQKTLDMSDELSLDSLTEKYCDLKNKIEARNRYPLIEVIGHGDLCFANTMYNKSTQTLKFIDPRGALTEEDLWTDQYYDVAKLSHSVCGRYDFFNHALFSIGINENFSLTLNVPFDNSKYVSIFRRKAEENAFDFLTIRIYEASLFLSMLPLHMDKPYKVLGFILNANNILKEIEKDV